MRNYHQSAHRNECAIRHSKIKSRVSVWMWMCLHPIPLKMNVTEANIQTNQRLQKRQPHTLTKKDGHEQCKQTEKP